MLSLGWRSISKYLGTFGRKLMTDLRIGSNKLEIEEGRWEEIVKEERVCRQCSINEVEDEYHFVARCPSNAQARTILFEKIQVLSNDKWKLSELSTEDQFRLLINETGDMYEGEMCYFR